jgi:hypothetical protein
MSAKDDLRVAVEQLSEDEAEHVLLVVRRLQAIAAWDAAPVDDEEETDEERALVAEARADVATGRTIPWSEVKRRLHELRG